MLVYIILKGDEIEILEGGSDTINSCWWHL